MQVMEKTLGKAYKKAKKLGSKATIKKLKLKKLIGRGGAGFSTGTKWEFALNEKEKERYIICNADEGEPGTFKDKLILEKNPENVVEGLLIGAETIKAKKAFIYLRGEYEYLSSKIKKAIKKIKTKTKSKIPIKIVIGQGAYICGEETAIMESIANKRPQPLHKPPFPTHKGLYKKPTVLNNVETLANVPLVLTKQDWNPKLRLYSVSGDVKNPGIFEMEMGSKLCDLVKLAKPKNKIKALYFGCFGGCIPYCKNIKLTSEDLCGKDCAHGAGTIIVVDNTRNIVDIATNVAKFFEFESCGKCTPCREGTMRVLGLLQNISVGNAEKKDLNTLQELAEVIKETSFCGLGQTATTHVINTLKYFRKDFEKKCKHEKC